MPPDRDSQGRRIVLKAIGAGSVLPILGGVGAADSGGYRPPDDARPPIIHPQFGYSGTGDDDVPNRLSPDETVELHVEEGKIDTSNFPALTVAFGAFHFAPLGLHVDPGAIVKFDFETPEHTVTAYHTDQERQQRVPLDVPAFSSPVNEHGGYWLYRFEEEGVYDLFCAPHEYGGMGMRIVVGDSPGDVVRAPGRPPLPLTAILFQQPELAPQNIVTNGPIGPGDVNVPREVTISAPTPI